MLSLKHIKSTLYMVNALKYSKKFKAHDEKNEAKIGDIVRIMETSPLSAIKRLRLVEVVEKAVII